MVLAAAIVIPSTNAPAPGASAAPTAAELDALLAPIALYQDQLLAQMLLCAAKPATVGALSEWLRSHGDKKGPSSAFTR